MFFVCAFVSANAQLSNAYLSEEASKTFSRLSKWRPDERKVVFHILTDLHHGWWGFTTEKIDWAVETDQLFGYDFMVNLGDIGLNATDSKDYWAWDVVCRTKAAMGKFNGVYLYVAGNHDFDAGSGKTFKPEDHYSLFQRQNERYAGENYHVVRGTCYGYYDIPWKQTRIIFISSQTKSDGKYLFGDDELNWLSGLLADSPKDWNVVILSHFMPNKVGHWKGNENSFRPGRDQLIAMLNDFVARKKGTLEGIKWDFTKVQASLVGVFCGDSHAACYTKEEGVNYYISQGYGLMWDDNCPINGKYIPVGKYEMLNDVIAISLDSHKVKSFRMGVGGEEYDLEFDF